MSFPRYPAYRDSGVEWLGEVPEHWEVVRLKQACEVFPSNVDKHSRDDEPPVFLCNYTDVYYNEKITQDMAFMSATATPEQIARFTLKAGDTIITKDSETTDDIAISAYVPRDLTGVVCGYHLSMIRPRSAVCGAFVKRLFDSGYLKSKVAVAANGLTRVGLGQYAIDNLEVPLPPEAEQVLVSSFLDDETAKIDALVAEQERLIELLKEKRQAVISHAVTKGLDPSVPMKDSGVEWLGEVPAHWEVRQVRSIASFLTSGPRGWSERVGEEGSLFVQSGDLTDDLGIAFSQAKRVAVENDAEATRTRLLVGDVVVCITGAKTGNVAVCGAVEEDAYINQHLCLIRPKADVLPRFLGVFLKSDAGQRYFGISQYGLKQGLSLENVKATPLVVPPVSEQEALVKVVTHASEQMDQLIGEAVLSIELLRERRTALISAAVTGQIDVRGWAPAATAT